MIALVFLGLAYLTGRQIFCRLVTRPAALITVFGLPSGAADTLAPWFVLSTAWIIGLQVLTAATYALAILAQVLLPEAVYPLLPANVLVLSAAAFFLATDWIRLPDTRPAPFRSGWHPPVSTLRSQRFFWIALVAFILYGSWLACSSFSRNNSIVSAGSSVFSDFAPHTALVSSFAKGRNFPTDYPHFAGDGIAYHFLFYFLCGNLNYLGLPIDQAINWPSILSLTVFCVLLGTLAVTITREKAVFLLAPFLMFFRSSFAFLTRLRDLLGQPGIRLSSVIRQLYQARVFIGDTPRDDWGLWGLNVYANQRHLLFGFAALIVVLFLFLPFLRPASSSGAMDGQNPERWSWALSDTLVQDRWFPKPEDRGRLLAALLIVALLPYFHGSALVSLLVLLAGLAMFSRARAAHAAVCLTGIASAIIQGRLFRPAGSFIEPQILLGFIAEDRSLTGLLAYLIEMSGLVLPLALIAVLLIPGRGRLLPVFLLPLVFGMTISLTPDVTVNHKYLIITFALCGCLVAGLLVHLWKKVGRLQGLRRLLVVILLIFLTATGFMELLVFRNLNEVRVEAQLDSPLAVFVESNTPPKSVFISSPLHYHTFFFTGRKLYLGHAYYAWSAGHDTWTREQKERRFLAAVDEDLAAADAFIRAEGVDYLLIDDELRRHPELTVNEPFFLKNYQVVAQLPSMGHAVILDLNQHVSR